MTPQDIPRTDTPAKETIATVVKPAPEFVPGVEANLVWTQPVEVVDFYAEVECAS